MKIAFVTDSSSGIHPDVMKQKGIYSIPLQIVLADQNKTMLDFVDVTNAQIYQYIKDGISMTTSIPPLGMIEEMFHQIKEDGYDAVFCLPINPGLSSAHNAFRVAAQNENLMFLHVDIHTTSVCQAYCIENAKRMYDEGKPIEEIISWVQATGDSCVTFVVPNDLDQLKKGGRLTPLAATLAGLLKIKPIMVIDQGSEGKIDVFDKIRTYNKAMDRIVEELENRKVDDTYMLAIAHSDGIEYAEQMKQKLHAKFPSHEIEIVDLISVISVHTGIGCIGVQAFKK